MADEIARSMKEAGFSRQDEDSVKLHLTLMNTRYAVCFFLGLLIYHAYVSCCLIAIIIKKKFI